MSTPSAHRLPLSVLCSRCYPLGEGVVCITHTRPLGATSYARMARPGTLGAHSRADGLDLGSLNARQGEDGIPATT